MSNISKLIQELCPDGVEFKLLGDISVLVRGNGMPKTDFVESGVGAIHYGQIYTKFGVWADEVISFVPEDKADKLAKVNTGDIIITNTSENFDDVCKAVAWLGDDEIVTGGHATVIKHGQNAKFLSYYFQSLEFQKDKKKFAFGTKVIDVSAKNLAKIKIPVPPLVVQEEIVRILDRFTFLEAELEAELEARTKQYAFYSESAFDDIQDHIDTTIGGLATSVISGSTPRAGSKEYYLGGSIPWLRTGEIEFNEIYDAEVKVTPLAVEAYRLKIVPANSVVVAISGATAGKSAVIKTGMATNQHCCCIQVNDEIAYYKYVFYWIKKEYLNLKSKGRGARSDLNAKIIKDFPIVLPPLEEQIRIANLLDKFDALVNDISSGLPAEIAARRKQYEHYRDQLLTFKELEPAGS